MTRRLLYRSSGGIDHYWVGNGDGTYTISSEQRVDVILDKNRAMANHNNGYSPSREMRRVGSIPNIVALKWLKEEGWWCFEPANADKLMRKLNDIDYRWLRTAPGRLGISNGVVR